MLNKYIQQGMTRNEAYQAAKKRDPPELPAS
jgi:hypothetical protein